MVTSLKPLPEGVEVYWNIPCIPQATSGYAPMFTKRLSFSRTRWRGSVVPLLSVPMLVKPDVVFFMILWVIATSFTTCHEQPQLPARGVKVIPAPELDWK